MRYSRIFPSLESFDPDLSFFHVETPDYPPEADLNMGDSNFAYVVEDLTDTVEHIILN